MFWLKKTVSLDALIIWLADSYQSQYDANYSEVWRDTVRNGGLWIWMEKQ